MHTSIPADLIEEELFIKERSFQEAAERIGCTPEELELAAFALCKENPTCFNPKRILTKQWLEEKRKTHSIIAICNITGMKYKHIQYELSKLGVTPKKPLGEIISKEEFYHLYAELEWTDKQIADKFGSTIYAVRRLRLTYGISDADRTPLAKKCPIEFFHRLFVQFGIGTVQIAELFDVNRAKITELRRQYVESGHPLAKEIADRINTGTNLELFAKLLQKVPHKTLAQEMRTKDIYQVAVEQGIIEQEANTYIPFSKEWLTSELQTKSIRQIASETDKSIDFISELVHKFGIPRPERHPKTEESVLRELFINRYWSDSEIASHLGLSSLTVKHQRLFYGIHADERLPYEEKLPAKLFISLYLKDGLSLAQISSATRVPQNRVRSLKNDYIASGYTELAGHRVTGVTNEKLEYITKQINLNLYAY